MAKSGNNDKYTITYNICALDILTECAVRFGLVPSKKKQGKRFLDELNVLVQNTSHSIKSNSFEFVWVINVKVDSLRNH